MTIKGIPSGDHECWCLLVTKKDFLKIKKKAYGTAWKPDWTDVGPFAPKGSKYRYKIYPDDLIPRNDKNRNEPIVLTINVGTLTKLDMGL